MAIKINLANTFSGSVQLAAQAPQAKGLRLAFIGDAPFSNEEPKSFCSSHRSFLFHRCKDLGINLSECFLGNILDFFPSKDDYTVKGKTIRLNRDSLRVKESYARLEQALLAWEPNVIIFLSRQAFSFIRGDKHLLDSERGSPFKHLLGGRSFTALGSYHPKEVYAQYELLPWLMHDLEKACRYSRSDWKLPEFNIKINPSLAEVREYLSGLLVSKQLVACDIETNYGKVITCLGFATSSKDAFVIPFIKDNKPYWSREEELTLWPLLAEVLETLPLLGHNAVSFDHMHLLTNYGINANFVEDTMLAQWEACPEGPKSLAFVNSLYGDTPYWKDELGKSRASQNTDSELIYNGKDCCATYNAYEHLAPQVNSFHYQFNISTSRVFQHMSLVGARVDLAKRDTRLEELKEQANQLAKLFSEQSNKEHVDLFSTKKQKGFNVRSAKTMNAWLYNELKLPPETKRVKDVFGEVEDHETSDYLTILHLAHNYPEHEAIRTAGLLRKVLTRISHLNKIITRPDGTVSWGFNIVGTDTTRVSGYKPLDGLGVQPQNVDRRDRDLFLPSEALADWYKADLEGADSWTVAAILSKLGAGQLMEDLLAGLKPAQRAALSLVLGDSYMSESKEVLLLEKYRLKEGLGPRNYLIGKKVSHGTNYYMQAHTMSKSVFKESDGEIFYGDKECKRLGDLLIAYYHLDLFHDYMKFRCAKDQELSTSFDFKRKFLGRSDNALARSMMSHLPQCYTTFTTNTVANRLFYSEENRRSDGTCLIRLCNMVHDEIDFIAPAEQRARVAEIFYRNNVVPLVHNDISFTIPFDAEYGPTWGQCKTELKNPNK